LDKVGKDERSNALKRILVADDMADIRFILQYGLERAGYEVILAEDGCVALELALNGSIDAAIIDIRMPQLNGIDLLKRLRATEITKTLPVILLTASALSDEIREGIISGASAYIVKPFTISEVVAQIQANLP
jgi:DNA-binding response OmpR family regulator